MDDIVKLTITKIEPIPPHYLSGAIEQSKVNMANFPIDAKTSPWDKHEQIGGTCYYDSERESPLIYLWDESEKIFHNNLIFSSKQDII